MLFQKSVQTDFVSTTEIHVERGRKEERKGKRVWQSSIEKEIHQSSIWKAKIIVATRLGKNLLCYSCINV